MSDKQKSSKSEKNVDVRSTNTIKTREWRDLFSVALGVMAFISSIISLLDFISIARDIPPVVIGIISGVFSIGILLYSINFLYQRQQKQKIEIEDELREYEHEFLTQVNLGFSTLLEEKVG